MRIRCYANVDFASPTTVSTLTVLLPFTQYQLVGGAMLFAVINLSAVETVTMTLETSEDGVYPDQDKTWTTNAGPTTQASIEIGPGITRCWWRLSANTQSPFNPAQVKWRMKGVFQQ